MPGRTPTSSPRPRNSPSAPSTSTTPSTDLCQDRPGTAPGTKITEARLKGAAGKRQRHIQTRTSSPPWRRLFGRHLIDHQEDLSGGSAPPNTGSRYITTPGASTVQLRGAHGRRARGGTSSRDFVPGLRKAFPNHEPHDPGVGRPRICLASIRGVPRPL